MLKENERREREQAVYQAVLRLIGSGADLSRLRVQEIAAEAGIGKGTVYEYFASKEEILRGVTGYCIDTELARVQELFARCETLDDVETAVKSYLADLFNTRAEVYRVVVRALAASSKEKRCPRSGMLRSRVEKSVQKLVERLQARGEIDPGVDRKYATFVLLSVWMMYMISLAADGTKGWEDGVSANGRRMMLRALRPVAKPAAG